MEVDEGCVLVVVFGGGGGDVGGRVGDFWLVICCSMVAM